MKRWLIIVILAGASIFFSLNLDSTRAQLDMVEAELDLIKEQLESARTEMEATQREVEAARTELESAIARIASTESELLATKGQLQSTETELATTSARLGEMKAAMAEKETALAELQVSYEGLMTSRGYTIADPTYSEMMRFIREDDTDKTEYIAGEYECTGFATDLCNRAEAKGIRCGYVSLKFPGGKGHAIVAFDTIDRGLIYIEPQYDDLVALEIGRPFYQCVVPSGDYIYEKSDYDDTILEVLVAW